jgi:predicted DNA-binding helix-hairpin-helix protein
MNILEKAKILGKAGKWDSCGPKACEVNVNQGLGGIYYAKAEHKTCRIFKTLMENNCSFDCKYCANSSSCKKTKAKYEPKELAKVFEYLHKKLAVEGIFLSSVISSEPDKVTEKMLEAVRIIRFEKNFNGYIHFKVLPGTSYELIKQASELSNRMSINLESPNKSVLSELSSCKEYKTDILRRQAWISKMDLKSGQTTQMIINNLANDKDVLKMVDWEYNNFNLKRMYYSAFKPIKGTPLEDEKAEPMLRQNHLYNVDFLMRCYNFKLKEFNEIMGNGMLPREDPKLALAKANFSGAVDINQADFNELIRIPGIGPKTAQRIISGEKIKKYEDLHNLGGWVRRAKPFIEVDGKRQTSLIEF